MVELDSSPHYRGLHLSDRLAATSGTTSLVITVSSVGNPTSVASTEEGAKSIEPSNSDRTVSDWA